MHETAQFIQSGGFFFSIFNYALLEKSNSKTTSFEWILKHDVQKRTSVMQMPMCFVVFVKIKLI